MSPFFIALTLTDVLLLTLLVALPVRVAWWAKLLAIVVTLSFNFLAYSAADAGRGWPMNAALPASAQFVACEVIEPNISSGEPGRIYVWEIPLNFKHGVLAYRPSGAEPRAYSEAYDRSLHKACLAAAKTTSQGAQSGIRGGGPSGPNDPGRYHAYVLPSIKLPTKGAGQ